MATNKNQHFVPRCYLRPFTVNSENKAINLFNIDIQKIILNAPVKNQCSRDYFYGEDLQLEKAFQSIESEYARVLKDIAKPGYQLVDDHRNLLQFFWLLQYARTEAASKRAAQIMDDMGNVIGGEYADNKTAIRDAVQNSMLAVAEHSDIVNDLKICLLKNKTSLPFITSDDPAILTNRWYLKDKRTRGFSFGLNAAGSILILPLTSNILCLGYDGDIYSVMHKNGWVDINCISDIKALNQHQYLNCMANIYVQDSVHAQAVLDGFIKAKPLRPKVKHVIHYAVFDVKGNGQEHYRVVDKDNPGDHEKAIIHAQAIHANPNMWPKQLGWRTKGIVFSNGTGVGYVRRSDYKMSTYQNLRKESAT